MNTGHRVHIGSCERWTKWRVFVCCLVVILVYLLIQKLFVDRHPETVIAHTVCLTRNPTKPQKTASQGTWYAGNRKFHLPSRWCDPVQKHITIYEEPAHSFPRRQLAGFAVQYQPLSSLPSHYTIIEKQTAYFLGNPYDFSPENFYHFTKQIYFPLYWLIKSRNQLHEGAQNIVFYPFTYAICHDGKYFHHDIDRYKYFKEILHVTSKLEVTVHMDQPQPHEVCYRNAVFSSEIFLDKATEAIDYFKATLDITDNVCTPNVLVIINRTRNRRILNIDELKQIGTSLGYDTREVFMEKLTLKEQAQLIHCTKVLAGVTGAGLQWAFFMKDYSGVIEIGWPHKDWPLFFTGTGAYNSGERDVIRPLKFVAVTKASCQLNPKALNLYWEELFYTNGTFTEEESLAIVKDERNYHFFKDGVTSLGKICDVVVDPKAFRTALVSAGSD